MSRKMIAAVLFCLMVFNISAYAATPQNVKNAPTVKKEGYPMNTGKAIQKLSRGLTNIATSPGEIFYQMPSNMEKSPDYMTGFFSDIFLGGIYMVRRLGAGLYDVFTSPFPCETNYKSVIEPETIWGPVGDFLSK